MDEVLLPPKLLEMRIWASEQRHDVRIRVLALCDALEDCGMAVYEAGKAARATRGQLEGLRADLARLRVIVGRGEP